MSGNVWLVVVYVVVFYSVWGVVVVFYSVWGVFVWYGCSNCCCCCSNGSLVVSGFKYCIPTSVIVWSCFVFKFFILEISHRSLIFGLLTLMAVVCNRRR